MSSKRLSPSSFTQPNVKVFSFFASSHKRLEGFFQNNPQSPALLFLQILGGRLLYVINSAVLQVRGNGLQSRLPSHYLQVRQGLPSRLQRFLQGSECRRTTDKSEIWLCVEQLQVSGMIHNYFACFSLLCSVGQWFFITYILFSVTWNLLNI